MSPHTVCSALKMYAWAVVLGVWTAPGLAAQTAPLDSSRHDRTDTSPRLQMFEDIEPNEEGSIPALADELVRSLGHPWAEIRAELPPPDSIAFDAGLVEAWWSVPGFPADGFRALIQKGRVESVTLGFPPDAPDLDAFAARLYDRLGSPRADGFYATDQTGYPYSLAVDVQGNRLTARAVPGQLITPDR